MTPPQQRPAGPQPSWHTAARSAHFSWLLLLQQKPLQEGLLRVHPVAGLLEGDAARTVEDLAGHLLAAVGRQAVHDARVRRRQRQQVGVDLVASETLQAQLALGLL